MTDQSRNTGPKVYDRALCCDAPHLSLGLCTTCYQRYKKWKKNGIEVENIEAIVAIVSGHPKRKAESRHTRSRNKKDRRTPFSGYWRESTLKKRYGIDLKMFNDLLISQDGCAICHEQQGSKRFFVDHCHETGKVRGVLCPRCNTLVGFIETAGQLMEPAQNYIESNK